jgi:ribosomal protein S6--L-glutamate ligase
VARIDVAASRSTEAISIGFLLRRHPPERASPIIPEVIRLLQGRGASVEAIYADELLTDIGTLGVAHDLYVLKSKTDTTLSLAGVLHAAGAAILNPYPVSAACRDKIVLTGVLRGAGVPLPETYVTGQPAPLAELLQAGPIVVKPYRGSEGRDVRVVRRVDELDDIPTGDGPLFAQRYHAPSGRDRKLYRIGDQVFGVKRVWPIRTHDDKLGEPFEVTGHLREIALRCGAAFGITLYGLDVIESDDGPYIVDFSSFPGFKGVPDAARLLADYIWRVAQQSAVGARRDAVPPSAVAPA